MKMIEESPTPIHLSINQKEILKLLMVSPRELVANDVCRFLDKSSYFSAWRSLQALQSHGLVTRTNDVFYSITEKGVIEYDKRRR